MIVEDIKKYLRVVAIFGLLFYFLGALIVSLDVVEATVFLVVVTMFATPLIIGLLMKNKSIVLLGSILAILGTLGPMVFFLESISGGIIGYATLGGMLILVSIVLFVLTVYLWIKHG